MTNELTPELKNRLDKISKEDVLKFIEIMESQKKEKSAYEMDYEVNKNQELIRKYPIMSSTESGELTSNLDNVDLLDLNTRLEGFETSACLQWDILQNMGIMPQNVPLTKIYKQLKVSHKGLGRTEKVSIATGVKAKNTSGLFDNLFKKRKTEEENSSGEPNPK
jgi:hypothetical protein